MMLILIDTPFLSLAEAEAFIHNELSPLYTVVLSNDGFDPSSIGTFVLDFLISSGFVFGEVA